MEEIIRRTWAEIDLDALEENYKKIEGKAGVRLMPVIKSDAYGHGAVHVARLYEELGARYLAVATLDEGILLRKNGVQTPILVLGYTPKENVRELLTYNITQTIFSGQQAKEFQREAQFLDGLLSVHIKIDTGMSRLGFYHHKPGEDLEKLDEVAWVCNLENLNPEGIFTHFSSSDEPNTPHTDRQIACFADAVEELKKRGIRFPLRHCCNSAGILNYETAHMDMVRPGIILYGLSPDGRGLIEGLRPAMSIKSVVADVREARRGDAVSYGRTYEVDRPMVLATVPIGYADGYFRELSNCGYMMIHGQKAPIVGRVCMDQTIVDITHIEGVCPGDRVTVMGEGVHAGEIARLVGTINYEIICAVSHRIPRVYRQDGQEVASTSLIKD